MPKKFFRRFLPDSDTVRASKYLAGGGLGLFVLPDEVNTPEKAADFGKRQLIGVIKSKALLVARIEKAQGSL